MSTTSSTAGASRRSSSRAAMKIACSPRISTSGTCATPPAGWSLSPPSPAAIGRRARPNWNAITALPSLEILGEPAPGQSTGIAMSHMEQLAQKLPPGVGFDWTGLSYEERLAGGQARTPTPSPSSSSSSPSRPSMKAGRFPLAVMLVVPLGVIGAALAAFFPRPHQRRLFPGRPRQHRRPLRQKRHPHRRIRQGQFRAGMPLVNPPSKPRTSASAPFS